MNAAERWMSFAREDLRAAEILFREDVFSLSCFHAQQAVEKALKAALSHRDPERSLPRTHSISELAERLGDDRARFPEGLDTRHTAGWTSRCYRRSGDGGDRKRSPRDRRPVHRAVDRRT